ncbi:MAG: peptide chain release factor N(5)-glutamine methyltransferase [Firmicutes bacterium]|nr:peptide chain release factor N(5)-glutamine methyltransferase [Bacillota bacterium]
MQDTQRKNEIYKILFGSICPQGLTAKQIKKADKIISSKKPLSAIFKTVHFFGFNFKVSKNVLAPRMETELLCEAVIKQIKSSNIKTQARVLDLCCGSGCIAITIAKNTSAKVEAVDISNKALEIARFNAKSLGADISFYNSNLFSNVKGEFDFIVSNPPYVETGNLGELTKYEPKIALDGGADGLHFYRRIARDAFTFLKSGGKMFLEIGAGQADQIVQMLTRCGFTDVEVSKDYSQIERIVICKKS